MKTRYLILTTCCMLIILSACKKSTNPPPGGGGNGGGGGGTTTKKWLIKSISTPNGDGAGHTTYLTYDYNDTGRILKAVLGYGLESNSLGGETFIYKPDGKLDSVKIQQAPGYTFVYLDNFSFQVLPVLFNPGHDNFGTYYFNGHSAKELDGWSVSVPPGSQSGSNYSSQTSINYNSIGGVQGMTGTDYNQNVQDLFAAVSGSTNPNDSLIRNPCTNGTSIEQRFIYYTYGLGYLSLGPNWLNGTYEGYSYASGVKKATGRWNYSFTKDANGNVTTIVYNYADDPPNFGHWQSIAPKTLTYEQH